MLTVKDYARAKKLPENYLRYSRKLEDGLVIPYFDKGDNLLAVRYRFSLGGPDKFRWRKGDKPCLYGLEGYDPDEDHVTLVEGESDQQTLWGAHIWPALGVPGATSFKREWLEHFDNGTPYAVKEDDEGGATFIKTLLRYFPALWVIEMSRMGYKDINAMHCALSVDQFRASFTGMRKNAVLVKAPKKPKPRAPRREKDYLDIVQVASQYTDLKPGQAEDYWGLCPLHPEARPSFHITPAKNAWFCFGCGEGGTGRDLVEMMRRKP